MNPRVATVLYRLIPSNNVGALFVRESNRALRTRQFPSSKIRQTHGETTSRRSRWQLLKAGTFERRPVLFACVSNLLGIRKWKELCKGKEKSKASAKRGSRAVRAGKVGAVRAVRVPRSGLKLIVRASKRITRVQVGRGERFLNAPQDIVTRIVIDDLG